jgi:diadenylate cyclase
MIDLREHLDRQRCVFLNATDKKGAIEELVGHLCRSVPELQFRTIVDEVLAREEQLSTRIAPHLAIPHAQLDGLEQTYVTVGRSRPGIAWEAAEDTGFVPLAILIVGGKQKHLEVLSALAQLLEKKSIMTELLAAGDGGELFQALVKPVQRERKVPLVNEASQTLVRTALDLSGQLHASALFIHLPPDRLPDSLLPDPNGVKVIFVVDESVPAHTGRFPVLSVPFRGSERAGASEVTLLLALTQGLVKKKDTVVSLFGRPDSGQLDTLSLTEMSKDFEHFLSIPIFGQEGDIQLQVFMSLLEIARELAREGREGKPVGALFVLGDHPRVTHYCQQMVVNPFKGYDEDERNVLDPSMAETLKEFSRIDGAIVIRGDGVIVSAGTYLRPDKPAAPLPAGLGARHAAAALITAVSGAVSFAISESTRQISLFYGGERIMVL